MPNTLLTPDVIAKQALATLYENAVAAQLVHRDYSDEFVSKVGDTITIRKPAVFEADEFNPSTGIDIQDGTEAGIPVTLNHHADVSFAVTSKELSLDIVDFASQLLDPAMEAIAQKIDRDILSFRDDITQSVGTDVDALWSHPNALIDAQTVLSLNNVPQAGRFAIVGSKTKGEWLKKNIIQKVNESGSTAGLREASLGDRLAGFGIYESQNIGQPPLAPEPGDPTTEVNVAFHRTAVALVTRQLELPSGASNAYIANYKGFGVRVVIDYDITKKRDVVSLDVLYGVKTLDKNRAVLIKGADYSVES